MTDYKDLHGAALASDALHEHRWGGSGGGNFDALNMFDKTAAAPIATGAAAVPGF